MIVYGDSISTRAIQPGKKKTFQARGLTHLEAHIVVDHRTPCMI